MTDNYLDLAREGINHWWRYVVSIILIVFTWLFLGNIPAVILILLVRSDKNPQTQFHAETSQFEGVNPLLTYLAVNFAFVMFILALYIAIRFIHKRKFITLITPYSRINWQRILQSFSVYFSLACISSLIEATIFPGSYKLTLNISNFLFFIPIALILTPIQTSVEELFFRGYLMQGISLKSRKSLVPIIITSLIFMLLHLANPEVASSFLLLAAYYLGLALFLAIITVKDNTLELALGVHAANNLFNVVLANYKNSALPSPSIFTSQQLNPLFNLISFILMALIFYAVFFRKKAPPTYQ